MRFLKLSRSNKILIDMPRVSILFYVDYVARDLYFDCVFALKMTGMR